MNERKRRITALFMSLCMALSLVTSIPARAEDGGETEALNVQNFYIPPKAGDKLNVNGVEDSHEYFKIVKGEEEDGNYFVEGNADDYNLYYNAKERVLTFKNLHYTFNAYEYEYESGKDYINTFISMGGEEDGKGDSVTINLTGDNYITVTEGIAIDAECSLSFTGEGTLSIVNNDEDNFRWLNSGKMVSGDVPLAMHFTGDNFSVDKAKLTLSSKNKGSDLYIPVNASVNIANEGRVEGRICWDGVGTGENLVEPKNNKVPAPNPPEGYEYIGKAYYFEDDDFVPSNIFEKSNSGEWTIYGEYDSFGRPITSKVYYQYLYASKATGIILTDDIDEKTSFLVYDDEPEKLLGIHDVAAVADGENHVFNTDIYCLWMSKGNVTVNGNVIVDVACNRGIWFDNDNPEIKTEDGYKYVYIPFLWENDELYTDVDEEASAASSVTVTGDVGLISLGESFKGDVTVKGDIDMLGYYEDLNSEKFTVLYNKEYWDTKQNDTEFWESCKKREWPEDIDYGFEGPAEHIYPAQNIDGKIVDKGKFTTDITAEISGEEADNISYGVFEDSFFMKTERTIEDKAVKGTTAVVNKDALRVDVTADKEAGVDDYTYPLVRKVKDDTKLDSIKEQLTNSSSKLSVMDISLVCQKESEDEAVCKEVEPSKEITLYLDGLTGFTKPALYHVKDDGKIEKLFAYAGSGDFSGSFSADTGSFSTYFVAEDQMLKQDLKAPVSDGTDKRNEDGGTSDDKTSADKTAADTVTAALNNLPAAADVTTADESKIAEARKAYDALTAEQKALVSADALKKLADAEAALAAVKQAASTLAPAEVGTAVTDTSAGGSAGTATYIVTDKATGAGDAGEVEYSGESAGSTAVSITIPDTIVGSDGITYEVTKIADNALKGNKTVKEVIVGNNIVEIGVSAFQNATKLTTVKLGKNVAAIDKNAFAGCSKLKKVTASGSKITTVAESAFSGDKALTSIDLSKSKITTIGKNAFSGDKKLKTIKINANALKKVGKNAFKNIKKKATIIIYAKDKKTYNKAVKLIKKSGAKNVKYKFKKKK